MRPQETPSTNPSNLCFFIFMDTPIYSTLLADRPSYIRVNLSALTKNFRVVREYVGNAHVMPVLKANAYGHGLLRCARHLEQLGADAFGVAFLEEGLRLREAGIRIPILALGGICTRQIVDFIANDIDITASSIAKLRAIESCASSMNRKARVHLKIDTGMERIGVHYYNAAAFLEEALRCQNLDIVGIYSHLATSEASDTSEMCRQLKRFRESVNPCLMRFEKRPQLHIANSGAILQERNTHLDIVRPGLLLYGLDPTESQSHSHGLVPVLSLKSEVVYFKVVEAGAAVSYGHTWKAPHRTRIVTVPLGYGDGYSRALSNKSHVLIGGRRVPVVGRVCMDQLMVDIGSQGTAYNGDEVILVGTQGEHSISMNELAALADTDTRDLLLRMSLRLPVTYE